MRCGRGNSGQREMKTYLRITTTKLLKNLSLLSIFENKHVTIPFATLILAIWTVAMSPDYMYVEVFEFSELSVASNAAPVIGSSPEVLDKIVFVFRHKSAMCAGNLACGNLIRRRCILCLLLLTAISYQMLEQIVIFS